MKKAALLCIFVMLIGAVPAFAANSNNITPEKQFQIKNSQISGQINVIKAKIKNNLNNIWSLLIQNKNLRQDIQKLRKNDKNNQPLVSQEIKSIKSQIKNNITEIKSLFGKNKDLRKEIQSLVKNQTSKV